MSKHPDSTTNIALVLVVDDDATMRLLAREALESAGYAVAEAASGEEAMRHFEVRNPDLVFLDVVMPGMDGFDVLEMIRRDADNAGVPVVMMTGLDDTAAVERAYEVGATNFISKPINWLNFRHQAQYFLRASRTARDLRTSHEKLALAHKIARIGDWDWDVPRDWVALSPEMFDLLGIDSADVTGSLESFLSHVHDADRDRVRDALENATITGAVFSVDHRMLKKDGETLFVHTRGKLSYDINQRSLIMFGVTQDITTFKAMEHRLVESERLSAMGEMAGEIGHELNNYLAAIGGRAELIPIALERGNMEIVRKGARVVAEQIGKMRVLTDGLLESARGGRTPVQTDLNEVIQATLEFVEPQNKYDGIEFDVSLHERPLPVFIDPQQLQQVILNLLSNGADAIHGAGGSQSRLRVESTMVRNEASIRIQDTGTGIDRDARARIFEPRFTTKATGHGFGLAVCHRIVKAHGGRIELESEVGKGTTFTIHFPLHREEGSDVCV